MKCMFPRLDCESTERLLSSRRYQQSPAPVGAENAMKGAMMFGCTCNVWHAAETASLSIARRMIGGNTRSAAAYYIFFIMAS